MGYVVDVTRGYTQLQGYTAGYTLGLIAREMGKGPTHIPTPFHTILGYPHAVSDLLGDICMNLFYHMLQNA